MMHGNTVCTGGGRRAALWDLRRAGDATRLEPLAELVHIRQVRQLSASRSMTQ